MGEGAFEAMVAKHHAEIYRYLLRTAGRAAEDLSQETFLRAFRARGTLTEGANVRAWLFTIATNLCRNHHRAERRRARAHAAASAESRDVADERPDGAFALRQAAARIDALVGRLPLKQRLAFTLRKLHDVDYDTIAQSLRCSPDAARAHVFQALRKIRRGLGGEAAPGREPAP